ncbi:MAG: FAD-dependent oxidoreductase [Planctomycetota bacterium]
MRYDAIVIGAGLSGLAAAARLAQFDKRVVLLERHEVWGGLNSFYTLRGRAYDVGLHALTNFVPKGTKRAPLTKILRQLRIPYEALRLGEQRFSEIVTPRARLRFTNDFEDLVGGVADEFGGAEADRLRRLGDEIRAFGVGQEDSYELSAREWLAGRLNQDLIDMLLVPILYYGSAREDDIDLHTFSVLFQSILLEGLSRPNGGVRTLLNLLVKKLKAEGAELRLKTGVQRIVADANGDVHGVVLDDGTELESARVLSSAGWVETQRMLGREVAPGEIGRLSFLESISSLDREPKELGIESATAFYSTRDRFRYREPESLVDVTSGVMSAPNNFIADKPLKEGRVRLTVLANYDRFRELAPADYALAKEQAADDAIAHATTLFPDWRPATTFRDAYSPTTVVRYTSRERGAIYGSPNKRFDGETGVRGLTLIGTDQGYLGVVGAMMSGISMANRHALVTS